MSLSFRKATLADCEAVAQLINDAYRGDSSRVGWTTEAHLLDGQRTDADQLSDLLGHPERTILLAHEKDSSRLVGSVLLEKRPENSCYLGMFTVKPEKQTAGIGKILLSEAERFARVEFGCTRMEMTVINVRHELLAWYERRGYRRTGQIVPFPVDPRFGILKVEKIELEVLVKPLHN